MIRHTIISEQGQKSGQKPLRVRILTAASKAPGVTTRLSKMVCILLTRAKIDACSCDDGVRSLFRFNKALGRKIKYDG